MSNDNKNVKTKQTKTKNFLQFYIMSSQSVCVFFFDKNIKYTTIFINKNYLNDGNGCKYLNWLILRVIWLNCINTIAIYAIEKSYSSKIVNESYLVEIRLIQLPIAIVNWILLFSIDRKQSRTNTHTQKKRKID